MTTFHVVEDAFALLRSGGVYRQAKLYRLGDDQTKIYAAWGSGFVRLVRGSGTSKPNVSWVSSDIEP